MNKTISKFQFFPFHLVDPSPWPILLSFSLLNLTIGAVAYMHGFSYGGYILTLGFILTCYGMILWFRDVVIGGSYFVVSRRGKVISSSISRGNFIMWNSFSRYSLSRSYFSSSTRNGNSSAESTNSEGPEAASTKEEEGKINLINNSLNNLKNKNKFVFSDIIFWLWLTFSVWVSFFIGFLTLCYFYVYIFDLFREVPYGIGGITIFTNKVVTGFICGFLFSFIRYFRGSAPDSNNLKNSKVITIIFVLLLILLCVTYPKGAIGCIDLISTIYCEGEDDIKLTDSNKVDNSTDDNNYHFSISKNFVKEGYDSVFRAFSEELPYFLSTFGGAKIGAAVVKNATGLPPLQRGLVGALSAGASALALGMGGSMVKKITKNLDSEGGDDIIIRIPRASFEEVARGNTNPDELVKKVTNKVLEYNNSVNKGLPQPLTKAGTPLGTEAGTSSGTGNGSGTVGTRTSENLNNVSDNLDLGTSKPGSGGEGGNFIPSLLDENLSPLEYLINCEILTNVMILFHILLLVIILIQKYNINIFTHYSSVGIISKIFTRYKLNKLQKFINKTGEWSNNYLSLLIILNVTTILFYICLNIYVNIELSNNLSAFVSVYNKYQFKKCVVLLILFNNNYTMQNISVPVRTGVVYLPPLEALSSRPKLHYKLKAGHTRRVRDPLFSISGPQVSENRGESRLRQPLNFRCSPFD